MKVRLEGGLFALLQRIAAQRIAARRIAARRIAARRIAVLRDAISRHAAQHTDSRNKRGKVTRLGGGLATAILITLVSSLSACRVFPFQQPLAQQTYLGRSDNWALRSNHPNADRLFNAFDYGHAIVYESLLQATDGGRALDSREFDFVTQQLLTHPPNVPLEEAAIGPHYVNLVPEIVQMFSWAHMLHRQIYDVWCAPGLTDSQRDARIQQVLTYYQSRADLALSSRSKSMDLMESQPYSQAFRSQNPKFNGLLWSYHWLQMALYDALMSSESARVQSDAVSASIAQFFNLIRAPNALPSMMPMSIASAPKFSARYPAAANVFDNLHALHDVVADILVSPIVSRADKRRALLRAAAAYRDDTSGVAVARAR